MGFMDKVKEAAAKAGEGVKKGTATVKDKMEDAQLRKRADENAKQIGYMVVKQRTEGADNSGEIDRLAAEIVELEKAIAVPAEPAEGEPASPAAGAASEAPAPPPTSASEPASGDFKLD